MQTQIDPRTDPEIQALVVRVKELEKKLEDQMKHLEYLMGHMPPVFYPELKQQFEETFKKLNELRKAYDYE